MACRHGVWQCTGRALCWRLAFRQESVGTCRALASEACCRSSLTARSSVTWWQAHREPTLIGREGRGS